MGSGWPRLSVELCLAQLLEFVLPPAINQEIRWFFHLFPTSFGKWVIGLVPEGFAIGQPIVGSLPRDFFSDHLGLRCGSIPIIVRILRFSSSFGWHSISNIFAKKNYVLNIFRKRVELLMVRSALGRATTLNDIGHQFENFIRFFQLRRFHYFFVLQQEGHVHLMLLRCPVACYI